MKNKTNLSIIILLAGAASVYSQGIVSMADYGGSFAIQVYHGQSTSSSTVQVTYGGFTGYEEMGQTANTYNAIVGHTVYLNDTVVGPGYTVGLLAAPGLNVPLANLIPVPNVAITSWYNVGSPDTELSGFWSTSPPQSIVSIPNTQIGGQASVAIAVWANSGINGPANSLHDAQVDGYEWGVSSAGNIPFLGGGAATPSDLPSSITTFSTAVNVAPVPEPSTMAFGLVALGFTIFRGLSIRK